jgi:hypothetical protein
VQFGGFYIPQPIPRSFLMNRFASIFVAFGLATAGSTALAEQAKDQDQLSAKPQPVQMTDAQMDEVAAGLIFVTVPVNVSDNTVQVAIPVQAGVAASAAVAVLGIATSGPADARLGRQRTSQD